MAEEQKKTQERYRECCEGTPCADRMRRMMEAGKSGQPFNCAEMMSRMKIFGGAARKEKAPASE